MFTLKVRIFSVNYYHNTKISKLQTNKQVDAELYKVIFLFNMFITTASINFRCQVGQAVALRAAGGEVRGGAGRNNLVQDAAQHNAGVDQEETQLRHQAADHEQGFRLQDSL